MRTFLLLVTLTLLNACAYKQEDADLVVHNAVIHSMDEAGGTYQAMAIKDGRIVELGPERQILNKYSATETYDAMGQHVYPGLIDGHCHFFGYGLNKQKVDLSGTKSWEEVIERTVAFAKAHPDKTWILGRGWDQNDWAVKEFPTNVELNKLFPDKPVLLQRVDGHAAIANATALHHAGIMADTKVAGGEIIGRFTTEKGDTSWTSPNAIGEVRHMRYPFWEPTGVLIDNAVSVFQTIFDEADEATKRQALLDAQRDCFAVGLTAVCDAGLDTGTIRVIRQMQDEGALKMRVYAMVADKKEHLDYFAKNGPIKTDRLHVNSVKVYADGAMGSRGAMMKQPYSDRHDHHGLLLATPDHFREVAHWCKEHNFQMNTHCIGDSANKLLLDVYGETLGGTNDLRWRIEHVQVLTPGDRPLFAKYSIIPSVQPTHATSDGPWAEERIGAERIKYAYAYEDIRKAMGFVALGTDFPIEGIDPLQTFRSAVLRQSATGWPEGGYHTENALSRIDALRGMTIWNALAMFMENEIGSLAPKKFADLTVVNLDLEKASPEALRKAKVTATFVSGERVH
ncbi:MAG TPA: amidohydrolase [Flavobacteriales bacterium]|nr:amidohydrolase [Flavobacteriales bacterium]